MPVGDSVIPGYGNPAASLTVKFYLTAVKEEQLLARTVPIQVEPFLIQDLAATSSEILKRLSGRISSPTQLFILARDQAPVVQTSDIAIHRINHYPADSVTDSRNTYPLDSDLSGR